MYKGSAFQDVYPALSESLISVSQTVPTSDIPDGTGNLFPCLFIHIIYSLTAHTQAGQGRYKQVSYQDPPSIKDFPPGRACSAQSATEPQAMPRGGCHWEKQTKRILCHLKTMGSFFQRMGNARLYHRGAVLTQPWD